MTRRRRAVLAGGAAVVAGLVLAAVVVAVRDDGGDEPVASSTSTTLVGTPGAPGVGDPYFPGLGNGGYDVEHYDLALTWRADDGVLEGEATIRATATQDLSRFDLDLAGLTVSAVVVAGEPAAWVRDGRELVVTPARPLAEGAPFTTVVTYAGAPQLIDEGTDLYDVGWWTDGREAFVVGEPSGAQTFFPANDHPRDKASFTFHVTAPGDQVVIANGSLTARTDGVGVTTWVYDAPEPMATYLVQVAIGDLELVDGGTAAGVPIRHALHRSYLADARATVRRTGEMLEVLDDIWGPYPFGTYGVVAVDEPLGFALGDPDAHAGGIRHRQRAPRGRRPPRARAGPPMGRRLGEPRDLAGHLAERGDGHLQRVALVGAHRRTAGLGARPAGLGSPPRPGARRPGQGRAVRRHGLRAWGAHPPGPARGRRGRRVLRDPAPVGGHPPPWRGDHRGPRRACREVAGRPLDDLFRRWLYEPGLPEL